MTLSSDVVERLPHVEGSLNYLAPMAEKPMNLTYECRGRLAFRNRMSC